MLKDDAGLSALHSLVLGWRKGVSSALLKLLVDAGVDLNSVGGILSGNRTPLQIAVGMGRLDCVEELIKVTLLAFPFCGRKGVYMNTVVPGRGGCGEEECCWPQCA